MKPTCHQSLIRALILTILSLVLVGVEGHFRALAAEEPNPQPVKVLEHLTLMTSRPSPWGMAAGNFSIPLRETTGNSLEGLQVRAYGPYLILDEKRQDLHPIPGILRLTDRHGLPLPESGLEIPAGQEVPILLQVEGLSQTGDIRFDLILDSSGPERPFTTTVKLLVKDEPWLPFLVLGFGVFLVALIRFYLQVLPRETNRQRIEACRQQMMREEAAGNVDLEQRLSHVERRNRIGVNAFRVSRDLDAICRETFGPAPEPTESEPLRQLRRREIFLTLYSMVITMLVGLRVLYVQAETFGTAGDYLAAFLWGAGGDIAIRGFGGVLDTIKNLAAKTLE